jgi:hypothetical protein
MEIRSNITVKDKSKSFAVGKALCLGLFITYATIVQGQKFSMDVEKFSFVLLDSEIPIFVLEDEKHMVVFDGYPLDGLSAEVSKGVLVIGVPKDSKKSSGTIVVLYDKNQEAPMGISQISPMRLRLKKEFNPPVRMKF